MNSTSPKNVPPSFSDFLRENVGRNWVLARRTSRIVKRYGADVVCLSQQRYTELELAFERLTGCSSINSREPSRFLKAAASDMLMALRACADALENHQTVTLAFAVDSAKAARKAIAKAEGRK
jgi:hypothetical protein